MASFQELAVEVQEVIWKFVLPHRGVHWFEVEGTLHPAAYIRESIRFTQAYNFGENTPQSLEAVRSVWGKVPEHLHRAQNKSETSSGFFRRLLTTVPTVWGISGPGGDDEDAQADEIAYTRRCRELSSYTQITTMLSTCQLSRLIALRYIDDNREYSWYVFRGMGPLYKPRPMKVWQAQYADGQEPELPPRIVADGREWEVMRPKIYMLDLAVFRLHDSQGRPTPTLRHAPWQYHIDRLDLHETTYSSFNRVGFEWNARWGTAEGRKDFCPSNVAFFIDLMSWHRRWTKHLYWLVDGVQRPKWRRDYPPVVEELFEEAIATVPSREQFLNWSDLSDDDKMELANLHLDQEFEANGRRYYIVFVVIGRYQQPGGVGRLEEAGLSLDGPFPGGEEMWPEPLRAPVRFAFDLMCDTENLGTTPDRSFILSWEPTS